MAMLKLGWINPLTDAFGAHPTFGPVLDLNDGTSFSLVSPDGLELPPPPRTLVAAGNIRTQGERVTRAIYRHNRKAIARLILGPASSGAALTATIRSLLVRRSSLAPYIPDALSASRSLKLPAAMQSRHSCGTTH